jgi:hypothetical protein
MARIPNLFVIGAMKSGTTSLCNYLAAHPDIFMSPVKEPMHFSREENWSQGNDRYLALFDDATHQTFVGEGSTEYTKMPFRQGVAQRLHEFNPKARLIYLMRDPFDRIISQYKHMVKAGLEQRPMREAIQQPCDYLTNSYYAYQLRPYLEWFGPDALFVETFETFVESPQQLCQSIFNWLGIDATFVPPHTKKAHHVSPTAFQVVDDTTLIGKARLRFGRSPQLVQRLIPPVLKERLKSIVPLNFSIDFSSHEFRGEVEATKAALSQILLVWIEELENLTGRAYPQWRANAQDGPVPAKASVLAEQVRHMLGQILDGRGLSPSQRGRA